MMNRGDEIAEDLRLRLEEAKAAYLRAQEECRSLMAVFEVTSLLEEPAMRDGTYALHRGLEILKQAQSKYQHALKQFTDFTIYGKPPADGQA